MKAHQFARCGVALLEYDMLKTLLKMAVSAKQIPKLLRTKTYF